MASFRIMPFLRLAERFKLLEYQVMIKSLITHFEAVYQHPPQPLLLKKPPLPHPPQHKRKMRMIMQESLPHPKLLKGLPHPLLHKRRRRRIQQLLPLPPKRPLFSQQPPQFVAEISLISIPPKVIYSVSYVV